MDIGGGLDPDVFLEVPSLQNEEQSRANLSDVDEAIRAVDPTFTMPETYVQIIEEPASKALRFRYECEGRSAGSIPGASSTSENKTYPTIKVCGYKGCMVIVVSCITKDEPFKAHPHNLVGRECSSGVCTVKLKTEGDLDYAVVPFKNLGIQCIKRRDISTALNKRQELRVDPFRAGFSHAHQPQSIDLNAVRLCFQVFLTDESYHVQRALRAVYSDVIYDKKAMSELMIVRTSHCSGPVGGNTTVILLCEKVTRDDIEVLFFHKESGWADRGHVEFVHKQLALVFKTPAYRDPLVTHHVTVQYQLHRMSDGAKSNVYNFEYVPKGQDIDVILGSKRKKKTPYLPDYDDSSMGMPVKMEPIERTPPHHSSMNNPHQWQAAAEGLAAGAYAAWGGASPQNLQLLSPAAPAPAPASPHYHLHSPVHQGQLGGQMHMQHLQLSRQSPQPAPPPSVSPHLLAGVTYAAGPSYVGVAPYQAGNPAVSPGLQPVEHQSPAVHMQESRLNEAEAINFEVYNQLSISGNLSVLNDLPQVDVHLPLSELSDLSRMLNDGDNLSDSLHRLTTRDEPHF